MADADTLMRQAPMTIELYHSEVAKMLDARNGEGYSRANPTLVGALVQACVKDFQATFIANALENLANAIEGLKP